MTKPEITGVRSLTISGWIRKYLKDSKDGLVVTDIDGLFMDYKKQRSLLSEFKTRLGKVSWAQKKQLDYIDNCLKASSPRYGYDYWGLYIIRILGEDPETSEYIEVNGLQVTLQELKDLLNLEVKIDSLASHKVL